MLPPAPGIEDLTALAHTGSRVGHSLPARVSEALAGFRLDAGPAGALMLRNLPTGTVPATPATPAAPTAKDHTSELVLLTVAGLLGHAVGYRPEHGGEIVQNIVPTRRGASAQISTSSRVDLLLHTETAFHPHRPRYLLLLCLRGHPAAGTTLASVAVLLDRLDPKTVDTLFQPRFRTAVDASFLDGRAGPIGPLLPVLRGARDEATLVYDADLTTGADTEARRALDELTAAAGSHHRTVVLEPGDLLVIDNHRAVHGRTAFTPRFDGTDRWLQRSFVVSDLGPSATERDGRVITTEFALG
jgi:L-asparagine oxygenase